MGAGKHWGMPKDLVASDGAVAWSATHSAYGHVVATFAEDFEPRPLLTVVIAATVLLPPYGDGSAGACRRNEARDNAASFTLAPNSPNCFM
ncbi:MAG: RHS domain-containing protein [Polyangiaceae bacterium]